MAGPNSGIGRVIRPGTISFPSAVIFTQALALVFSALPCTMIASQMLYANNCGVSADKKGKIEGEKSAVNVCGAACERGRDD